MKEPAGGGVNKSQRVENVRELKKKNPPQPTRGKPLYRGERDYAQCPLKSSTRFTGRPLQKWKDVPSGDVSAPIRKVREFRGQGHRELRLYC